MNSQLLEILRCPLSGEALELHTFETSPESPDRIKTGLLTCSASRHWYPIIEYVPVMIPYSTPPVHRFAKTHRDRLEEFSEFTYPEQKPPEGEESVARAFSEEWEGLKNDELTFTYDENDLISLHRDVWLRETPERLSQVRTALNVGIGYGAESLALSKIFPQAEIVAIDINSSLFMAASSFLKNEPRVHPIVASLFYPPFAAESFDHVHSQGVIHHTYSTKAAFDSIQRFVNPAGSLFIWVYALEDSLAVPGFRGFLVRMYWIVSHRIFRPILSRSPAFFSNAVTILISAIMHPLIKSRSVHATRWKFSNTLHGIRDAFTPRYAHQHSFNEVIAWFEESGFSIRLQSPATYKKLFKKRLLGVGITGRRGSS